MNQFNSPSPCIICGSSRWVRLPDPSASGRITSTDGQERPGELGKFHCATCGLVSRASAGGSQAALEKFYSDEYELHERLAPAGYDLSRFLAYAEWMKEWTGDMEQLSILEVGCGSGMMLQALRSLYPGARLCGIEPSNQAAAVGAREGEQRNWKVVAGYSGDFARVGQEFDLAFSLHVVEHVPDPLAFIRDQVNAVREGGRIVIVCPDGTYPHSDMLFYDHLWSFAPAHLAELCSRAGLQVTHTAHSRERTKGEIVQLVTAIRAKGPSVFLERPDAPSLLEDRLRYLGAWQDLDWVISKQLDGAARVACFGAGEWANLLRSYCPQTWARVSVCLIDGPAEGTKKGIPVRSLQNTATDDFDAILLGVKPASQARVFSRLKDAGFRRIIRFDDRIKG